MQATQPTEPTQPAQRAGGGVGSGLQSPAVRKLHAACERRTSFLSVGLEPCPEYMPRGYALGLAGYERFLLELVEATADLAAAFKFNLAFFEALGPAGIALLYRVRQALPPESYVIADAKRGDIGSTAARYAQALFEGLNADAATVNPLMGRDSAEPFLAREDRLTFFLVLTSNPGASDFLLRDGLFRRIGSEVATWNSRGNVGMVVGATRPAQLGEVRALAGECPFLLPGVGAQGGELEASAREGSLAGSWPAVLFHVTRGVLPGASDTGSFREVVRAKASEWRERVNRAVAARESVPKQR